jgi:CheY-like chemotaxis protein
MIVKSTEEAAKLVRQLLQLSRPAAVETSLSNLGNLVSEAASVLAYRMRELGVLLEMSVEQPKVEIMVDPAQIKQVVINLMLNAMDAMEKSPRKELRVKTGIAGGKASLTVSDTGHGINPEDLNRIFDPFFTTKSPDRGTGLGLSVCLSILKYHQGEITVESLHGAGAVFRVLLPLAPHGAANRSAAVQQKTETPKRDSPGRGRLKVMIVDDEHYVTALVQEILRKTMGWQVERAHNGREAVDWLKGETANLLISDVRMPEMNGLDLYKWVKDNKPDLTSRMLFVTGDAGSAELTGALHALGCPVLYKPFTAATLIEHCHRLISD